MKYSLRSGFTVPTVGGFFVPGISCLGILWGPFAVLPGSQCRVFDLRAEGTGFASVRCGSGWCRMLSDVPGRHQVRNANSQAHVDSAHWCLQFLSIDQKPEWCLSKEMPCKCFSFFRWGQVRVCFCPIFVFLGCTKHTHAASFGIFVYFVWSHPCWCLNTIGKQMANFELLDQICVCLCLLNSQTVNYRV